MLRPPEHYIAHRRLAPISPMLMRAGALLQYLFTCHHFADASIFDTADALDVKYTVVRASFYLRPAARSISMNMLRSRRLPLGFTCALARHDKTAGDEAGGAHATKIREG